MNVSTRQLMAFVQAAQLRSFAKAAERLHITPAGLSSSIRELEAQFGGRLLNRTTRSVSLTEAGARLLPIAERVVADIQTAAAEVDRIETRARQVIRLGATPLVCNKLIPRVFSAFRRNHPHVKLQVLELQRDAIQECVASGELDIGFGIFLDKGVDIERTRLFSSRLYLVAAASGGKAGNPLLRIGQLRWDEIGDTPLIGLQPGNAFQQLIDRYLPAPTRDNINNTYVNHIETQIALAEIGVGAAVIPAFALPACRHYKVRVKALVAPVANVDFFRISRKGVARSAAVDEFTRVMVEASGS
ncbi:LysR substrate-binding domain-containing protein [Pigmentiphaga soli]|uniref:LysR substrate-binding domain-containing protein n=1 Tax=Pigmentiphaga soli TaxID=1007095 RepID=A0ABP8GVU8_9BURK